MKDTSEGAEKSVQDQQETVERSLALIEPVLYGDIFDFPVSLEEIHKFCSFPLSLDELATLYRDDPLIRTVVGLRDGFYFIKGREDLVTVRQSRQKTSEKCWQTVRRIARFIRYVPFVKGIVVTGSLAVNNACEHDDLDFMILTGPSRIWFVFGILGTVQRIISRRFLCPNYYLSIDHLSLRRKCRYVAREALQARLLCGEAYWQQFLQENEWITHHFPNAGRNGASAVREQAFCKSERGILFRMRNIIEWCFQGKFGDMLENMLKRVLHHRLTIHYGLYGQSVPAAVLDNALGEIELRFHGLRHEEKISDAFRRRREHAQAMIEQTGTIE